MFLHLLCCNFFEIFNLGSVFLDECFWLLDGSKHHAWDGYKNPQARVKVPGSHAAKCDGHEKHDLCAIGKWLHCGGPDLSQHCGRAGPVRGLRLVGTTHYLPPGESPHPLPSHNYLPALSCLSITNKQNQHQARSVRSASIASWKQWQPTEPLTDRLAIDCWNLNWIFLLRRDLWEPGDEISKAFVGKQVPGCVRWKSKGFRALRVSATPSLTAGPNCAEISLLGHVFLLTECLSAGRAHGGVALSWGPASTLSCQPVIVSPSPACVCQWAESHLTGLGQSFPCDTSSCIW